MNKKIKVTSIATAALASLVLANANFNNEVKADTKPVNATTKAQTPEEAAQANIDSAKKNVETEQGNVDKAKGDLDQAKKNAEKPDADYKTQSDKVDGLKGTADEKNKALTNAQDKEKKAQALVDEANDPAKVQAANDAVTKQEGVVGDANVAYTPTANITLYAKWVPLTYTVKYNGNTNTGGSIVAARRIVTLSTVLTALGYLVLFLLTTAYLVNDSYNPFLYFRF